MSETNIDKLKLKIDVLELNLKQLEQELELLKSSNELNNIDLENSYRVNKGEHYHAIETYGPVFGITCYVEENSGLNDKRYVSNNYFKTGDEASKVVDKINFLLKLERLHNIYCPDYEPDWSITNNNDFKYFIAYDTVNNKYCTDFIHILKRDSEVYFPNLEIAQKVCDILNKELDNNE